MSTIEINRVEDLREGDFVTLRWEHVDGATVTLEGPMWNRMVGGWAVTDARFVSATREAPEWEPGTAGTATVMGTPGVRVMRVQLDDRATDARPWFTDHTIGGWFAHAEGDVTDFVPDDASRWAAQAKLAEADLDNARAEVERWKAEAEMLTAKVDRLMPLQEHENECAYRQRAEKAEAEVKRLRAARRAFLD